MDITTISATLTSLSLASKFIMNSLEKIKDQTVRKKVEELLNTIIPLQAQIMTLQQMYFVSIKEKEALEKKLMDSEDWQKEASRYELKEFVSGVYVYGIKKKAAFAEPDHYLCAKCYNDRKKSILQRIQHSNSGMYYICHSCSSQILDYSKPKPQQPSGSIRPYSP